MTLCVVCVVCAFFLFLSLSLFPFPSYFSVVLCFIFHIFGVVVVVIANQSLSLLLFLDKATAGLEIKMK